MIFFMLSSHNLRTSGSIFINITLGSSQKANTETGNLVSIKGGMQRLAGRVLAFQKLLCSMEYILR